MSVLTFRPVYMERIWGGRTLETLLRRSLPEGIKVGESWEVCDRSDTQTFVNELGQNLGELWSSPERKKIFGSLAPDSPRFPILIKVLDAKDKLSLQVHPPESLAKQMGGEPKTEMWYFLHAEQDADIFVGLKKGVTKDSFIKAIENKTVASCFHRLKTSAGETMFLPSGRVHAIGAGNLILEIQQNSDTTYRVYDWDRLDNQGKPRDLHVESSLKCIHFKDYEPQFTQPHGEKLVECPLFRVHRSFFDPQESRELDPMPETFQYLFVASGSFRIADRELKMGDSVFFPANGQTSLIEATGEESAILITVMF